MIKKIIFGMMLVVLMIFLCFLTISRIPSYPMIPINFKLLSLGGMILFIATMAGFISYVTDKKISKRFVAFQITSLIIWTVVTLAFAIEKMHYKYNPATSAERSFMHIRNELLHFAESHEGHLPDANNWRETILEQYPYPLRLQRAAFNKYLSNKFIKEVNGKTVLLFHARSDSHMSGGMESINNMMQSGTKHVFVMFVDGTFADYQISETTLLFLRFDLHQSDYLPLRWQP